MQCLCHLLEGPVCYLTVQHTGYFQKAKEVHNRLGLGWPGMTLGSDNNQKSLKDGLGWTGEQNLQM